MDVVNVQLTLIILPDSLHCCCCCCCCCCHCCCCHVPQGEPSCVAQAVYVITAAVDRYKELCEGKYTGEPRSLQLLRCCVHLSMWCIAGAQGSCFD
jgi:hypothetical protein